MRNRRTKTVWSVLFFFVSIAAAEGGREVSIQSLSELPSVNGAHTTNSVQQFTFISNNNSPAATINPLDYLRNRFYLELYEPGAVSPMKWGNGDLRKFFGFWDGGGIWRVRVNFPKPGRWRFIARNTMGDESLQGIEGEIDIVENAVDTELARNGFPIRYDGSIKRLVYRNGKPFFWLGDTWWAFPLGFSDSFLSSALTRRVNQGFTVIQTHGLNAPIEGINATDAIEDRTGTRLSYFRDLDRKISRVNDAGLVTFLGYGSYRHWERKSVDPVSMKRLFFYLLARYGAFATNFLITQEYNQLYEATTPPMDITKACAVNPLELEPRTYKLEDGKNKCFYNPLTIERRVGLVNEVGMLIRHFDPYERANTVHEAIRNNAGDYNPAKDFPWVNFLMLQGGHLIKDVQPSMYLSRNFSKPFVESEMNWEEFYRVTDGVNPNVAVPKTWLPGETIDRTRIYFHVNAQVVSESAGAVYQAGGLGFSYGAQGLYNSIVNVSDLPQGSPWGPIITMRTAIQLPGPNSLRHLKSALQMLDWWRLAPLPNSVLVLAQGPPASKISISGYTDQREGYLIQLRGQAAPRGVTRLNVARPNKNYSVVGISPRSGRYWTGPYQTKASSTGTLTLPTPVAEQYASDFLLVVIAVD